MKRLHQPTLPAALALVVAVALAALLTACGGKVIDDAKAEEFIRQDLAGVGVEVERVSCPSGVEVSAGVDFECDVAADGEMAVVQMRIVDDEGLVKPIEIRSADAAQGAESKRKAEG